MTRPARLVSCLRSAVLFAAGGADQRATEDEEPMSRSRHRPMARNFGTDTASITFDATNC